MGNLNNLLVPQGLGYTCQHTEMVGGYYWRDITAKCTEPALVRLPVKGDPPYCYEHGMVTLGRDLAAATERLAYWEGAAKRLRGHGSWGTGIASQNAKHDISLINQIIILLKG